MCSCLFLYVYNVAIDFFIGVVIFVSFYVVLYFFILLVSWLHEYSL